MILDGSVGRRKPKKKLKKNQLLRDPNKQVTKVYSSCVISQYLHYFNNASGSSLTTFHFKVKEDSFFALKEKAIKRAKLGPACANPGLGL